MIIQSLRASVAYDSGPTITDEPAFFQSKTSAENRMRELLLFHLDMKDYEDQYGLELAYFIDEKVTRIDLGDLGFHSLKGLLNFLNFRGLDFVRMRCGASMLRLDLVETQVEP